MQEKHVKACGFLIYRSRPARQFLLMRHADRWDLPKGHLDPGESETACALRELHEETGIDAQAIERDPSFRFVHEYSYLWKGRPRHKTLVVFLARLSRDVDIVLSEHPGYQWHDWRPPHQIQTQSIDPLLRAVAEHWGE